MNTSTRPQCRYLWTGSHSGQPPGDQVAGLFLISCVQTSIFELACVSMWGFQPHFGQHGDHWVYVLFYPVLLRVSVVACVVVVVVGLARLPAQLYLNCAPCYL